MYLLHFKSSSFADTQAILSMAAWKNFYPLCLWFTWKPLQFNPPGNLHQWDIWGECRISMNARCILHPLEVTHMSFWQLWKPLIHATNGFWLVLQSSCRLIKWGGKRRKKEEKRGFELLFARSYFVKNLFLSNLSTSIDMTRVEEGRVEEREEKI